MSEYKTTYQVEVEYLGRDETGAHVRGMIDVPYISSAQFFDIMGYQEFENLSTDNRAVLALGRRITEMVIPGMLAQITPKSGLELVMKIFETERETLGMGEPTEPTATAMNTNPES